MEEHASAGRDLLLQLGAGWTPVAHRLPASVTTAQQEMLTLNYLGRHMMGVIDAVAALERRHPVMDIETANTVLLVSWAPFFASSKVLSGHSPFSFQPAARRAFSHILLMCLMKVSLSMHFASLHGSSGRQAVELNFHHRCQSAKGCNAYSQASQKLREICSHGWLQISLTNISQ